jgi:hypothetical protein
MAHDDEWRVEVELNDDEQGYSLGKRLRSHNLDDQAREALGDRVLVTRDASRLYLYTGSEEQAREAERVVRRLLDEDNLTAEVAVTRWHPVEEDWEDASQPLPQTEEERAAEYERHRQDEEAEAQREGRYDWEVQVELDDREQAKELAEQLRAEGLPVARGWRYVAVGALTEEEAQAIAERVRELAPQGAEVHVGAQVEGGPLPLFVAFGGFARE